MSASGPSGPLVLDLYLLNNICKLMKQILG